jgi:outer membrane biosynthesis protein TonB
MKHLLLLSMMLLSIASYVIAQEEEEYKGKDLTMPAVVQATNPSYPEEARKKNIEGIVYVKALIGANGDVEKVKIAKSANKVFDQSAWMLFVIGNLIRGKSQIKLLQFG